MFPCNDSMKVCVFAVLLVGTLGDNMFEDGVYRDAVQFINDCGTKALTLCLKEQVLRFIEVLPNNIDMGNGIQIKQINTERFSREYSPLILPDEAKEREAVIDRMLIERVMDYLGSHTLELKIPMILGLEEENSVEEGRRRGGGGGNVGVSGPSINSISGGKKGGKGKKKGGMGALMMMFYMKSAMLFGLGIKAVGALAFKALLLAKVALAISGIIALKKLMDSKGHSSATYEVIAAHPAHLDEHIDRAFSPAELVYRGYRTGS